MTSAEEAFQDQISDRPGQIVDNRAAIEQAKGMLALVYGLEDISVFEVLRWASQHHNMKLRDLAEQVVRSFRALSAPILPERSVYDDVMMNVLRSAEHR